MGSEAVHKSICCWVFRFHSKWINNGVGQLYLLATPILVIQRQGPLNHGRACWQGYRTDTCLHPYVGKGVGGRRRRRRGNATKKADCTNGKNFQRAILNSLYTAKLWMESNWFGSSRSSPIPPPAPRLHLGCFCKPFSHADGWRA